jgi:hypothetical protein
MLDRFPDTDFGRAVTRARAASPDAAVGAT